MAPRRDYNQTECRGIASPREKSGVYRLSYLPVNIRLLINIFVYAIDPRLNSRAAGRNSMLRIHARLAIPLSLLGCLSAMPAAAETPFSFSTGNPDGLMATATRPDSPGKFEIESADDFVITHSTSITSATFTGLLPIDAPLSDIGEVVVEIYRVFPKDSQDPPSMKVPTRVNSPSDVAFDSRDSTSGLTFTPSVVSA